MFTIGGCLIEAERFSVFYFSPFELDSDQKLTFLPAVTKQALQFVLQRLKVSTSD
jgi:hypothetical protein